ncbi:HAD family hydrolase [Jannaschia seohaensis]|uniref:Putative hydrolase of the HAD superfamily n=1 Tax=Jannaschia seohaensis TaxID=475081 RepID=A0A2Y9ARG8_9RHOB|nr:HAD family hydrolase [Jannaschia seohaensis]PWJ18150.1 putative hydrolase of the HAD superfamily [Jannaschia seohaensis]SSA46675.1 putative hydrolase of the HAD superfamily [Jannaschia seohaensis]
MTSLTTIGFDADDTLWHNETVFRLTQDRFADLLRDHADPDHLMERLLAAERRNLGHYGFGVKGFVLSMIETAIEVTEARVPASTIATLLEAGREMLRHPVDLLPGVEQTVRALAADYTLVMITKGDLLDQERKLAESGLGELFDGIEIVSEKTRETYLRAFSQHGEGPERALMVGNSMRSDVLPAIEAGAWGVYCPSELEWALEAAEPPEGAARYRRIETLADLPALVAGLR